MTPLQQIDNHPGLSRGIRLFIKRDDLVHPVIQGNKWRKLHILLDQYQSAGTKGIITFGGPFSNHIHAVAAAGQVYGFKTVGIIRGEFIDQDNPTLSFARAAGMQLFPVSKRIYNGLSNGQYADIQSIISQFPGFEILEEGGSHALAVAGCRDIALEIQTQLGADASNCIIAVPAGTGTTAAGIISAAPATAQVWVFPAAPYGVDAQRIGQWLNNAPYPDFRMINDYHFGAFAARPVVLLDFIRQFRAETGILLDPIYTSKMLFGLWDLLQKELVPAGATVVAVHTGGLQGWGDDMP